MPSSVSAKVLRPVLATLIDDECLIMSDAGSESGIGAVNESGIGAGSGGGEMNVVGYEESANACGDEESADACGDEESVGGDQNASSGCVSASNENESNENENTTGATSIGSGDVLIQTGGPSEAR